MQKANTDAKPSSSQTIFNWEEATEFRLPRNRRTGASKHFAFIEFACQDVANIVAETMNKYLLHQHVIVYNVVEPSTLYKDTWKDANEKSEDPSR